MRFIVDESTGAAVVEELRRLGYDVVSVAEEMPQAKDSDILEVSLCCGYCWTSISITWRITLLLSLKTGFAFVPNENDSR